MIDSPCFIANKTINSNNKRFSRYNSGLNSNSIALIIEEKMLLSFLYFGNKATIINFVVKISGILAK